ncbi:uncharacterized protein LOC134825149 [Bolinopsis microptera]|uniref:uncharacterized protein LOC134825149 n=1 Tax=Bolinopsis microptera TaxID=2820187 RepID=UPI003078F570
MSSEHAWISGGCPFKGRRIDSRGNIKYKGHMIVSSHELQFVLAKPKAKSGKVIDKELFPLKDIKSYGCHENVLSVRLGGESAEMGESNMVYFKMKEAVVVKEIMDQVIEMKRKPMPRMPSFDHAGGFYDMSPTAFKAFPGQQDLQRKPSLPLPSSMQNNMSYYDPSQMDPTQSSPQQSDNVFDGYSRAKFTRSTSTGSSGSSTGPLSGNCIPGHENPIFQFSPIVSPVQYAQVEIPTQRQFVDLPSPTDPSNPGKKKRPFFKTRSLPKFGYTKVDIDTMEALREIENKEKQSG